MNVIHNVVIVIIVEHFDVLNIVIELRLLEWFKHLMPGLWPMAVTIYIFNTFHLQQPK